MIGMNKDKVISRDGKHVGRMTGGSRRCSMEDCGKERPRVLWDDGLVTFPCYGGMSWNNRKKAWVLQ